MRDTPTPETDAAQHEGLLRTNPIPMQVVTANFARKLEQERDEAREQIEVCRGIIERTVIARNSALSELTDLERERDEAREALASREVVIAQQNVITDLILERDQARAVLQEIEAARWHTACELRRIATGALGSKT